MRSRLKLVIALSAFIVPAIAMFGQVVSTSQGRISGQTEPDSIVTVFKGVPYAAPPVGDLRWRAPQAAKPWDGVLKADHFSASCMQGPPQSFGPFTAEFLIAPSPISEDCLFLNIWAPKINAHAGLPVIVFIHGGGFGSGSGAIGIYDGADLAAKGVVVVAINYRLGVFGFLAHPDLTAESTHHSSGNYGLMDQIAALRWLRTNVAQFGGNPRDVTIWGQSAGAFSVGDLLASPLAEGLFQRAQADSGLGSRGIKIMDLKQAEDDGVKFASEHHAQSIKELRAMPAEALLPDPKAGMDGGIGFAPIVDGWVLPDLPSTMNVKGTDNDVPVITGYQAGDTTLFAPRVNNLEEYNELIQKSYGEMAADFKKLYPVLRVEDVKRTLDDSGRDRSRVSMFLWASAREKSHHKNVFTYYFDRAIPWPQHPEFGAFHTGEIPYFFLNFKALDRPWEKADYTVANQVSSYLVHFATNGEPTGPGLTLWPPVNPDQPQTMELGVHTGVMPAADKAKVEFWTRYYTSPISDNGAAF